MAPAATASAAIATPVSAAAPPVFTFVGQCIEDVLSDLPVAVIGVVEFMVKLAMLVIFELETETEGDIELVVGGSVGAELPAVAGDDGSNEAEGAAASAAPALVPQYVEAKAKRAARSDAD